MNAQIVPFQTKRHRTLALAKCWYAHLEEDYSKQGLIVDREKVIENAVLEAVVEERLGRFYWRNAGIETEPREKIERERVRKFPHLTSTLECQLDAWLRGKLPHLYENYPPRRPRCWKPKSDVPCAQIIQFPGKEVLDTRSASQERTHTRSASQESTDAFLRKICERAGIPFDD